jgi:hypothetical protein
MTQRDEVGALSKRVIAHLAAGTALIVVGVAITPFVDIVWCAVPVGFGAGMIAVSVTSRAKRP